MDKTIRKGFLLLILAGVIYACYRVFEPFLIELLVAAILTSIFYRPYQWFSNKLGGSKRTASLITCLFVVLIVIVPLANLLVYSAQESISAYRDVSKFVEEIGVNQGAVNQIIERGEEALGVNGESLKNLVVEAARRFSNVLVEGATSFTKGTISFMVSLIIIIFTMFFFFIDGERMAKRIMDWTPLPNKYNKEIFRKFREVSYSTVLATFVTAIAQGLVAALGFIIVGIPAFFLSILIAFFSLIPYLGSGVVWFPVGVYLLLTGRIWEGIFILVWGALIISFIDNLVRAYVIKGKSQAHPIFIIFSILGGIVLFGFWGVIVGPLIISLALTVLHIYELEFQSLLEKQE